MEEKKDLEEKELEELVIRSLTTRPIIFGKNDELFLAELNYSIDKIDNTILNIAVKFVEGKPKNLVFDDKFIDSIFNDFNKSKEAVYNIESYKSLRIFDDKNNILKEYNLQNENK